MKKLLLSFVLLYAIIGRFNPAYSQSEIVNSLVACYPFNGNANDASGNNNDGVVYGATLAAYRFGNPNSAYSFNGVNQYIEVPNSSSLQLVETHQQLTVTAWINVFNWYQGWNIFSVVDKYDSTDDGGWGVELYRLGYNVAGPGLGFFPSRYENTGCQYSFGFNTWYHIAVVYDVNNNYAKFYINDTLRSTVAYSQPIFGTGNGPLYIGFSKTGTDEYSDGLIDDIRIYDKALDSSQINAIYHGLNCDAGVVPPVTSFQSSDSTICADNCINFTDLSTNATSWQWIFAGAIDSTSSDQNPQNVCYAASGNYNVTLIASNPAGSDSVTFTNYINVLAAPPVPFIMQLNDTLLYFTPDAGDTVYQWYLDSTLLKGATDTALVIHNTGNYNVQITNKNGCSTGAGINIILGAQNYGDDNFLSLYPNPASSELTIHTSSFHKSVTVSVTNLLVQEVLSNSFSFAASRSVDINVDMLPAGIYFLQLKWEKGSVLKKFVKE